MAMTGFHEGRVTGDWMDEVYGYGGESEQQSNPTYMFDAVIENRDWNGWARPHFSYQDALRVLTSPRSGILKWGYDAENDAFFSWSTGGDPEEDRWPGMDITLPGGDVRHVYPIGCCDWTWREVSDENE